MENGLGNYVKRLDQSDDEMKKYMESLEKIDTLFNKFGAISITLLQRNFSLSYDEAKIWYNRFMKNKAISPL